MAEKQTKFIFVTGGVVSGLGKGITAASLGRLLKCRGLKVASPEAGPLCQRGPGHHEPLPARRGLRHRGRRRDRPGPGPLRALYRREPEQVLQPDHRQGVLERAEQGAPGRLPGRRRSRSSPTSPTRSRATSTVWRQTPRPMWSSPRSAAPPATSRASPSWRPSARWRRRWAGTTACYIHVTLVPYISRLRRAQVQAHPALRQGAAGHGHQPGHHRPAAPMAPCADEHPPQDQHCSATCKPDCVIENLTLPSLYEVPADARRRTAWTTWCAGSSSLDVPAARPVPSGRQMVARIAQPQQDR